MSVKGYLALLVGVFVGDLLLVTLARVAIAVPLIRLVLRDIARPFHSAGALDVTASIGVASGAEDGWEGLVRRADTGLYAAKEGGRNRVVAGPPAEAGSRAPGRENAAR